MEGESVFHGKIRNFSPEMMMKQKWHLLSTSYWDVGAYWVQDVDSSAYWMNMVGDPVLKDKSDTILDTKVVDSYDDLDWSVTGYLTTGTICGWLSPEGKWYGCAFKNQGLIANLVLNRTTQDLKCDGWVCVEDRPRNSPDDVYSWRCERRLTPEQRNWLSHEGHTIRDSD